MDQRSKLYTRCRKTLLKCDEFNNDKQLRSVFVTPELRVFQDRLPQCTNKEDRVTQTIAYLLSQRLTDNRPVLPLLLAELRDRRHLDDALHHNLDELHADVALALGGKVIVPFVIAAMTQGQAADLTAETVFQEPDVTRADYARFQQFKQILEDEYDLEDLLSHYGEQRESWRPLTCPGTSIAEIISDMLDYVNERHRASQSFPHLLPHFLSDGFFAEDRDIRRPTLRSLRELGGVLIVDALSMFHPVVNRSVSQSGLSSSKRMAILVVSPVDNTVSPVNQLIEEIIDLQMETALTRFEYEFDRLCEIGVGNLRALKRWLFTILPETVANVQKHQPNPATLQEMRQMREDKPLGIHRAFPGSGGIR